MNQSPANRQDLYERVAEQAGVSLPHARLLVDTTLQSINQLATHNSYLQIRDFGRFEVRRRAPRKIDTPVQGEPTVTPARLVLWFTCAKGLVVEEAE